MRDPITGMVLHGKRRGLAVPENLRAEGEVGGYIVHVYLTKFWFWRVSWGVPGVDSSWRRYRFLHVSGALGFFHLLVQQHGLHITWERWEEPL